MKTALYLKKELDGNLETLYDFYFFKTLQIVSLNMMKMQLKMLIL